MSTPDGTQAEDAPEERDAAERRSVAYRLLVDAERVVSCALVVGLLAIVLVQVVSRYVFNNPFSWSEEVARFLLVWLTFVAAGYVTARKLHIVVDLVGQRLGHRLGRAVDVVSGLLVFGCAAVMAVAGAGFAVRSSALAAPATGMSLTYFYGAAVVGFGLILLHTVAAIWFARDRHAPSGDVTDAPRAHPGEGTP